jgi:hypothetical protein
MPRISRGMTSEKPIPPIYSGGVVAPGARAVGHFGGLPLRDVRIGFTQKPHARSAAGLVLWSARHMHVHQIGRRHHVVVQIGHDPERSDDDQEHDEHA